MDINKVKGMIISACLGDALGAPFELRRSASRVYTGNLVDNTVQCRGMFGSVRSFSIGQMTDDSEMLIILLSHIMANGGSSIKPIDELIKSYMEWANHPTTVTMGKNTRACLKGIKTCRGHAKRMERNDTSSQGNGFLMRCSPLVLVPEDEWPLDCMVTNPNEPSLQVQRIYLRLLRSLIETGSIGNIIDEAASENIDIITAVDQAISGSIRDVTGDTKGWAVHGLYLAIYVVLHLQSFPAMYAHVISAGGDTDTNACIAGAAFGALHGYERLQAEERSNLDVLFSCSTEDSTHVRPPQWRASRLLELV